MLDKTVAVAAATLAVPRTAAAEALPLLVPQSEWVELWEAETSTLTVAGEGEPLALVNGESVKASGLWDTENVALVEARGVGVPLPPVPLRLALLHNEAVVVGDGDEEIGRTVGNADTLTLVQ